MTIASKRTTHQSQNLGTTIFYAFQRIPTMNLIFLNHKTYTLFSAVVKGQLIVELMTILSSPKYHLRFILLVGYTLCVNIAKTFGIKFFSTMKPNVRFAMRSSKEIHAVLVFYFTCQDIRQKSKFFREISQGILSSWGGRYCNNVTMLKT